MVRTATTKECTRIGIVIRPLPWYWFCTTLALQEPREAISADAPCKTQLKRRGEGEGRGAEVFRIRNQTRRFAR